MKRHVLILLAAVVTIAAIAACAAAAPSGPIRLMRRPDINGDRIVFSYQGDLWLVSTEGGLARRLTVHPGVEDYPKFSPDGRRIAFTGDYNERRDCLFVMPADGGEPVQLTYHTASEQPVMWTRDGRHVIFSSTRESFVRFFKQFFSVPAGGGMPVDLDVGKATYGSLSPDGKKMAFNRHSGRYWWWKRYKGSANLDVWIYDFDAGSYTRVTDYEGNDSWPMWTGERIYFTSDRSGDVANLFFYELGSGRIQQVTSFEEHGITWPSMSAGGASIVFERDHRLYVLDTASGQAREVVVHAPADTRMNMTSYINPLDHMSSFDLSPTAKRLVFEARGEIFSAPAEHGDVRNLTDSPGSRDRYPAWSPDGRWIAYVSDRSGDDEIYIVDQMGKEEERALTSNGHFKGGLQWSPDSENLLFSNEANELWMCDADDGELTLVARNEHRDITTYDWSPDSRWVAYDFARRNRNRDIFIYDTKEKEHHQVTTDLEDDTEPVFTPDGKNLLLITHRHRGVRQLARLSLLPEAEEPFVHEDDEEPVGEEAEKDEDDDDEDGKGKKGKKKEKVDVKIDFDRIEERIRHIPKTGGRSLRNVQAAEKYIYYQIQGARRFFHRVSYDLYAYDLEKFKGKKVAENIVTYGIAANCKKIAYYDGSNFYIIKVGAKAGAKKKKDDDDDSKGGKLDIKRKTVMKLDRRAEWRQIMNEGWRVVNYHFYDPNHHGVDWDGVKTYYEGLLPHVRTRHELNLLMTEMVGELNASHQGVSGGDGESVPRTSMGYLGAKIVLDEESGLPRFERIYGGSKLSSRYRSPLDADYVEVKEGDYLIAVNGHELEPRENYCKYLVGNTRNKVSIVTNDKPSMKGAVETRIAPLNYDVTLRYKDWVDRSAEFVDGASNGRIGYMHLADMSGSGWVEFRESFEKYRYKDAIIIDVRYNGGGNIDMRIIDYLERVPYHTQRSRGESPLDRPSEVFTGKVVVLHNEYSYSDAEVFPSAVKERGLGTLIGVPTLGFVIAVTPHRLIDGGAIRKTFIGIWEKSTGDNLESKGAIPDIHVESPPEMEKIGRDVQLEKAIEFLMEQIGATPRDFDYETLYRDR